jgi:hypothetical protein
MQRVRFNNHTLQHLESNCSTRERNRQFPSTASLRIAKIAKILL